MGDFIVNDSNGLCISFACDLETSSSGLVSSIYAKAKELGNDENGQNENPGPCVVSIETEKRAIAIETSKDLLGAVLL